MRLVTDVNIDVVVAFDIDFNEDVAICVFGAAAEVYSRHFELVSLREFDEQFYFAMRPNSSYYTMSETLVLHGIYSYIQATS